MAAQGSPTRYLNTQGELEEAKRRTVQGRQRVRTYVERYPIPAALMAFALGVGVGVWIGSQLFPTPPPPTLAEKVGRQILDTLGNVLPERVMSRLHG